MRPARLLDKSGQVSFGFLGFGSSICAITVVHVCTSRRGTPTKAPSLNPKKSVHPTLRTPTRACRSRGQQWRASSQTETGICYGTDPQMPPNVTTGGGIRPGAPRQRQRPLIPKVGRAERCQCQEGSGKDEPRRYAESRVIPYFLRGSKHSISEVSDSKDHAFSGFWSQIFSILDTWTLWASWVSSVPSPWAWSKAQVPCLS